MIRTPVSHSIRLDTADRTVHDIAVVRAAYGHVINYSSRVELEVDRNVLELLTLLPDFDPLRLTRHLPTPSVRWLHPAGRVGRLRRVHRLIPASSVGHVLRIGLEPVHDVLQIRTRRRHGLPGQGGVVLCGHLLPSRSPVPAPSTGGLPSSLPDRG